MTRLLEGKVIAITGAGGGLGRAYAHYLAKLGAKLVINDLGGTREGSSDDASVAASVVKELEALDAPAVAHTESISTMKGGKSLIKAAVDAFGRIDVLINNAGILRDKTLLKMTEEQWDQVIAVHLKGTFACSQAAAEQLKAQGDGGVIINTSSYAGLKGNFGQTNYAAAKAGIYGMTLTNAQELVRHGVRVNAVAPMAKTRMTEDISVIPDSMTVEHVAPVVAFLASDLASDVNGRVFGVHGEHVFEYRMLMTPGLRADWTPESIAEKLEQIASDSGANAPAPEKASAAGGSLSPSEQVGKIFEFMPAGFRAERAGSWSAVLHWEIAGTGDFTITVKDGTCVSETGKHGTPSCTVVTDTETFLGLVDGSVDGQQAYMQGKITATNINDLMKYQSSIDAKKSQEAYEAAEAAKAASGQTEQKPDTPEPAAQAPAAPAAEATPEPSQPDRGLEHLQAMPEGDRARLLLSLADGAAENTSFSIDMRLDNVSYAITSAEGNVGVKTGAAEASTSTVVATSQGLWQLATGNTPRKVIDSGAVTSSKMSELLALISAFGEQPDITLAKEIEARGTGIQRSALGKLYHGDPVIVKVQEIQAFSEATNETLPLHLTNDRAELQAPPLFPARFFNEALFKVLSDRDLKVDLSRLVFGEIDFRFHAAIKPGDLVVAKARSLDVEDKDSGQILRVGVKLMREGEATCEAVASLFIRWAGKNRLKRLKLPKQEATVEQGKQLFEVSYDTDVDQPKRFAEAANDPNPIHLDDKMARAVGFDGVILHGLCTMATCGRAIIAKAAGDTPDRLKRLKVRFSKPVKPGCPIATTAFEAAPVSDTIDAVHFTAESSGAQVITAGEAEIARSLGGPHA